MKKREIFLSLFFILFLFVVIFALFVFVKSEFGTDFAPFNISVVVGNDTPPVVGGGGGSGGGSSSGGSSEGGTPSLKREITLNRDSINVFLSKGETKQEKFIIENTGDLELNLKLTNTLSNFVRISEQEFTLKKDESKEIFVDFIAFENTQPNIYLGEILISGVGIEKKILLSMEVESPGAIFDVRAAISEDYLRVKAGNEFIAEVTLINVAGTGLDELSLEYQILDFENNLILGEQENLNVRTEETLTKKFVIPENTFPGNYVFYVRAIFDEGVGSSSANFEVVKQREFSFRFVLVFLVIIAAIVLVLIVWFLLYRKRDKRKHRRFYKERFED